MSRTAWFTSVMGIINSITMLAIILAGAAVVRERAPGTMDHLLVMPLTPFEIAMSKIGANGLVIIVAVGPVAVSGRARAPWHTERRIDPTVSSWRRRSICSSRPQSASSSVPSRDRCRSSACSFCWPILPLGDAVRQQYVSREHAALARGDPLRRRPPCISCRWRKRSFIAAPALRWFGGSSSSRS